MSCEPSIYTNVPVHFRWISDGGIQVSTPGKVTQLYLLSSHADQSGFLHHWLDYVLALDASFTFKGPDVPRTYKKYEVVHSWWTLYGEDVFEKARNASLYQKRSSLILLSNWTRTLKPKSKCSHEKATFVRMALVCPSCGFVGGL